ncbi:xylanase [hot springs metagenome]|uniref:Xylanase n=1 Tax=hot springs metagenome TaxID=433727 RepID=A0A5J4L3Y7_9ZZZZ
MQNRKPFGLLGFPKEGHKSPFCPRPIPVLMYHHINPHKGDMVTVTPEVFEGQMEFLHKSRYRTLKIDDLLDVINGKLIIKEKSVVVTFDDGWLDNYVYAYPVLKRYKINAAIFLITDRVEMASNIVRSQESKIKGQEITIPAHSESKNLIANGQSHKVSINWDMAKEMQDSGLVEFYSHTKSHAKCDRLSEKELWEELHESKKIIEEKLSKPCPYLCWPYGKHNEIAVQIAKDIGYKAIFTTRHGVVEKNPNPFSIKRIVVKDNIAWFKKRMVIYTNPIISELYLKIKKK